LQPHFPELLLEEVELEIADVRLPTDDTLTATIDVVDGLHDTGRCSQQAVDDIAVIAATARMRHNCSTLFMGFLLW
jgi:hypothetical protein